jgi:hypothetical protein
MYGSCTDGVVYLVFLPLYMAAALMVWYMILPLYMAAVLMVWYMILPLHMTAVLMVWYMILPLYIAVVLMVWYVYCFTIIYGSCTDGVVCLVFYHYIWQLY